MRVGTCTRVITWTLLFGLSFVGLVLVCMRPDMFTNQQAIALADMQRTLADLEAAISRDRSNQHLQATQFMRQVESHMMKLKQELANVDSRYSQLEAGLLRYQAKMAEVVQGVNVLALKVEETHQLQQAQAKALTPDSKKSKRESAEEHNAEVVKQLAKNRSKLDFGSQTAVVVVAFNRPRYLDKTLKCIQKYLPPHYTLIVSQDGDDSGVSKLMQQHYPSVPVLKHTQVVPELDSELENPGYYYIANHYGFFFGKLIWDMKFENVIVLEDDMEIAPDFFSYFENTIPILKQDSTLWTVSAFNDNGQDRFVSDARALWRSDFFPGLGWVMTKRLWDELGPRWPRAYWDDWMREPTQRKGRMVIRPEVCRSRTFGVEGTSEGQYYDSLSEIKLNDKPVTFSALDLSYLLEKAFQQRITSLVSQAVHVESARLVKTGRRSEQPQQLTYSNFHELAEHCEELGLMINVKAGVPRGAYMGIVSTRINNNLVLITPTNNKLLDSDGYAAMVAESQEYERAKEEEKWLSDMQVWNEWYGKDDKTTKTSKTGPRSTLSKASRSSSKASTKASQSYWPNESNESNESITKGSEMAKEMNRVSQQHMSNVGVDSATQHTSNQPNAPPPSSNSEWVFPAGSGWHQKQTATGRVYFVDKQSGMAQFDPPPGAVLKQPSRDPAHDIEDDMNDDINDDNDNDDIDGDGDGGGDSGGGGDMMRKMNASPLVKSKTPKLKIPTSKHS